jgi:hypothetical protein
VDFRARAEAGNAPIDLLFECAVGKVWVEELSGRVRDMSA